MDEILDRALGQAEQAEVYRVVSSSTPVSFEANRLKLLETTETRGAALRVIKGKRLGFSAATDLRDPARLVDAAIAVAELGAEAKFEFPATAITHEVQVYDPLVEGLEAQAMIDIGQELIDHLHAYNPDILCGAEVSKYVVDVFLLNSKGGEAAYKKTVFGVTLQGNLIRDSDMLDVYGMRVSCKLAESYQDLAAELIDRFEQARVTAHVSSKPMQVLFTPRGFASTLMLALQAALNGKTVLQGASPLGDKLGQQVCDPRISLFDDGTIEFAPQSAACDDEGVPMRRTPLIQDGVLRNFYYDLQTAGQAGKQSTGNGSRSLYSMPGPSLNTVIFEPGSIPNQTLLESVKEGVLVDQVMGAWAGNVLSGDFSANLHLGYKIENGQIMGRVKDTMVAGNVFDALRNSVEAIGAEAVWVGGGMKVPPFLLNSISVSSKY